ncbi:hypothetical protein CRG98_042634 [Punica granatum]|uniref:Uncharacterized protein n=1 Tax=Punica granatum TaxID=22663 RepID=A0A2I0HZB1_PUNGR|nr:hypothetical protein CRG98_042634 [Punica granatum]
MAIPFKFGDQDQSGRIERKLFLVPFVDKNSHCLGSWVLGDGGLSAHGWLAVAQLLLGCSVTAELLSIAVGSSRLLLSYSAAAGLATAIRGWATAPLD